MKESALALVGNEQAEAVRFSLGLGLTNECNLACSFCYRDPSRVDRLTLPQVKSVMERLPVRSVNLGTGENGMHPEF
jgi:MoaA/NifB/PqqE/SkfB family radical SAM enzyme